MHSKYNPVNKVNTEYKTYNKSNKNITKIHNVTDM